MKEKFCKIKVFKEFKKEKKSLFDILKVFFPATFVVKHFFLNKRGGKTKQL